MKEIIYTVAETAQLLKVNKNSVYNLVRSGLIKAIKLGTIKIPAEELERFVRDNTGKDLSDLNDIRELEL
ncbi:helix-turn-helix domain-containing protein [Clostridium botulinum]|nr:helix-turn-helix domain-containing protein [Clostridium botulinum]NFL58334.1 helix-turn-helix domain-containing protein [Clostridium botulinum]NFL62576.1 helix-turn-helix domain-containing protein [Clostridium botulinum]